MEGNALTLSRPDDEGASGSNGSSEEATLSVNVGDESSQKPLHPTDAQVEFQNRQDEITFWRRRAQELESEVARLEAALRRERLMRLPRDCNSSVELYETVRSMVRELLPDDTREEPTSSVDALMKGLTTKKDISDVTDMCDRLNALRSRHIVESFYKYVMRAAEKRDQRLVQRDHRLPQDWYRDPWYYMLPYCLNSNGVVEGFDRLTLLLPYLQHLGFKNILILSPYESPCGNGGSDISGYVPREELGGVKSFNKFLDRAIEMDFRVATDITLHQTSTEHPWFQRALEGSEKYRDFYLQVNGREKIDEYESDGRVYCTYRDPDGSTTQLLCNNANVDRTHGLWAAIDGKIYQFFRSSYPFEVDLNLHNHYVLDEIFAVLERELSAGILGKRLCSVDKIIGRTGPMSDTGSETHTLIALLKSFIRHVCSRATLIADVRRTNASTAPFAGISTKILGHSCSSEADLLPAHNMQTALLQMTILQNVAPFWRNVFSTSFLPENSTYVSCLEDEGGFNFASLAPDVRSQLGPVFEKYGLVLSCDRQQYNGRVTDCLSSDPERVATAIFCLYMMPGCPAVLSGMEFGSPTDFGTCQKATLRRYQHLRSLDYDVSMESCFDSADLSRTPLYSDVFQSSDAMSHPALRLLSRLNRLFLERASLKSYKVIPVDSGRLSVLCLVRTAENDTALLCCANLSPRVQECALPHWQISDHVNLDGRSLIVRDLITESQVSLEEGDNGLFITLQPFARIILDCEQRLNPQT
mmetsp:Transcript_1430/g.4267  ORF Transcript_1430/g.4267 Transcript_1430/m.4267 type:complete len:757 (+) Transcript_1430:227-2497(+)